MHRLSAHAAPASLTRLPGPLRCGVGQRLEQLGNPEQAPAAYAYMEALPEAIAVADSRIIATDGPRGALRRELRAQNRPDAALYWVPSG